MSDFAGSEIYTQLARIGKVLANPVRLRLLDLLDSGERTVEQLSVESGVPLKNTSAQLQQLLAAHLVGSRKEGTRVYYRIADRRVSKFLGQFAELAEHRLADLRDAIHQHLGDPDLLQPITAQELRKRLAEDDTVVVDVRSDQEFDRGHLPGALSIPMEQLHDRLEVLPSNAEIIAYCGGPYCVVSPRAVQFLRDNGYSARMLEGGLTRWQRSGMRVTTGRR
jgi:rhodanese-related sulfurtransferase/DNA-binding transcriptional ArsR family regulator